MNERFKLRFWHDQFKEMFPVLTVDFFYQEVMTKSSEDKLKEFLSQGKHWCDSCGTMEDEWFPLDKGALMQCTGLKDINGKDIYEGDILRFEELEDCALVMYVDDGFKLVSQLFNGTELFPQTRDGIWGEVIGNSYENPELIKIW